MKGLARQGMKVVLIGYAHGEGGIQTHTRYLAEGLRERGYSVRIFSPERMPEHFNTKPTEWAATYDSLRSLVRLIRRARPDIAIVAGTGWKAMLGVLAAPRGCCKVFFEVMSGSRARHADPRILVNFGFDAIVGQGSPVTQRFVREFNWEGLAETIPALPEPLERQIEIPARSLRPVSDGVRFCYFGRLEPPKNVKLLVERFSDFAKEGSTLDIWGFGSDRDNLAAQIDACGKGEHIRLRGRYPAGHDYVNLLQSYDLLLLPTIAEEGAPLVLLEAMACGLPFVANGMGGIPDYANLDCIITDGNIAGFVPSVQAMVERLEASNIVPARLQNHYSARFSFHRLVNRWEAFLREVSKPQIMQDGKELSDRFAE